MIKSKTYNGQAGLNYIQSSDLAFAIVYVVKRTGRQHDKYVSGSTNRTYNYQDSLGRISFDTAFSDGGEKVFVIFKTSTGVEPETPPGVCVPVSITGLRTSQAVVGIEYIKNYYLGGSPPFTLNVTTKPSWATVSMISTTVVKLIGTPTTAGTESIVFSVSNCGTDDINETFEVLPMTNNFSVSNAFFLTINSVTGITYYITSGHFPVSGIGSVAGIHGDYTGTITVKVSNLSLAPRTLRLKKGIITLETKTVTANGDYTFASQSYLSTDAIFIISE